MTQLSVGVGVGVAIGVGILTVVGLKLFCKKKQKKITLEASNVNYPLALVDRVSAFVSFAMVQLNRWL